MSLRPARRDIDPVAIVTALGAVLVGLYLLPLFALGLSISPESALSELTADRVIAAAAISLATATISTAIAAVCGVPLGFWLATTRSRLSAAVFGLVLIPLVLPPTVAGVALVSVVGPTTAIGSMATSLGVSLTESTAGIVLAQTFVASPFVVITTRVAFLEVDPGLAQAARTLGQSRWQTARRVLLPLASRGILAGVTLAFARAMGEFGATMMLAYHPRSMPVEIWASFRSTGLEAAYPVAIGLAIITLGVLALVSRFGSDPWR